MIHYQRPINDWDEVLARLPHNSLFKCVDQGQEFALVKSVAAQRGININTCLRHWYDPGQVFGGTYEQNKDRARVFFETFIDGTFISQIAQHCDYIEEWNEYLANSQSSTEIQERVRWATAAADVWLNEYRTRPELAHIKLVLCNTAIGNWIDREFAVVARTFDAAIGYHPYSLWQNRVRWTGDWANLSGLWDAMEYDWGINVEWVFTEAGPFESAVDGWRSSNCLGGNRDLYVEAMRQWIQDVQHTPAYAEGRIAGFALFTTGRVTDTWKHYWTELPELNMLADMFMQEWNPGTYVPPAPPPPDDEVPYVVVVNLLSQNATLSQKYEVIERVHSSKETILQSADDAARLVAPGRPGSKVKVWGPDEWEDDIVSWLHDRGVEQVEVLYYGGSFFSIVDIVDELPKHLTKVYTARALTDITTLTIHHTVTPSGMSIESIANFHVDTRGWPGIGYHFVIKDNGDIYQTNYLETKSYHAGTLSAPGDENLWSVGIALQGDFTNDPPPQAQQDATKWLVQELKYQLDIDEVLPHRGMPGASTQCPGNTYADWLPYVI